MSEPKTQTFHLSPHIREKVHHQIFLRAALVAIRRDNQQSNNFRKEQQQNAKWSRLARYMCSFPAFPIGSPSKGVHYTPLGLRGQCPQAGLWLLTCHITNIILIFRAAGRKIWACRL
jgi:hypothetical protein